MIGKNNLTTALNVLYFKKEMYLANISKHNLSLEKEEKENILSMIPNGEGWYYIVVKQLPALLREITSKHHGDFRLNCLHPFRTENKLKSHIKACENKDSYNVLMPSEDTKILELINIKNLIKHHLLFM